MGLFSKLMLHWTSYILTKKWVYSCIPILDDYVLLLAKITHRILNEVLLSVCSPHETYPLLNKHVEIKTQKNVEYVTWQMKTVIIITMNSLKIIYFT